jgi:hypothetical protein
VLHQVHQDVLKLHEADEAYVRKLLSDDKLEIDRKVKLPVDPDERPRPTTAATRAPCYGRRLKPAAPPWQVWRQHTRRLMTP